MILVGLVGLVGWGLRLESGTIPVSTGVVCNPGHDSTWVYPNPVRGAVGDTVVWSINGGDADSLVVRPKSGQRWPFTGGNPHGRKSRPARSGSADTTGTFHYDVVLYCPAGSGGLRQVVIDPDIIIGGGH